MIGLEHIWGACGLAMGVCIATACLTFAAIWDEHITKKKPPDLDLWEKGFHDFDLLWCDEGEENEQ